jgi:anaerobic ribonucleoside-triphosphate reductase activating protein
MSVDALFAQITREGDSIEGVTIAGGEPLDQYADTLALLQRVQAAGLSTMLYTVYEMDEIKAAGKDAVFNAADILVSGRYDESKQTLHCQWIGSTNQEIHFLSERYRDYQLHDANYTEIDIADDGSLTIIGFPPSHAYRAAFSKSALTSTLKAPRQIFTGAASPSP